MNNNGLYPFMQRGMKKDLNTVIETGFYRIDGTDYENSPVLNMYGVMLVFKDTFSYVTQIVLPLIGGYAMYARAGAYTLGTWSDWKAL